MGMFEECSAAHSGDLQLTLQCVTNWLESENSRVQQLHEQTAAGVDPDDFTTWMLLFAGSLVFFMQSGFAMLCAGSVRKKNLNNTMLKNLLDATGAAIAFYVTGWAFAYGTASEETTFIGSGQFFLQDDVDAAAFFFQYGFSAAAVTIVAGTLEERCQMSSYFCYSLFFVGFVYPVIAHNIWGNGFLSTATTDTLVGMGVVDFAGCAVVHMSGGFTALFASIILGPRQGRFYNEEGNLKANPGLTKGHSAALQILGTMILWFGWYGFNPGSALVLSVDNKGSIAAHAAVTTTLAGATGCMSALFMNGLVRRQQSGEFELDLGMAMNGLLSGLVAITAGCAVVELWAAPVIGLVGGWVYYGSSKLLIKLKIDDAVDAIPVHLFCGIWGILAVGLFTSPDLLLKAFGTNSHTGFFYSPTESNLMGAQLCAIAFVMAWTFITMFPFFMALDSLGMFRVNSLEELVGLDAPYEDNGAPKRLFDDNSDSNEEIRLKAYKKRFEERKQIREGKKGKKSLDELLNLSWGNADLISVDGATTDGMPIVRDKNQAQFAPPDQVPRSNKHLEI